MKDVDLIKSEDLAGRDKLCGRFKQYLMKVLSYDSEEADFIIDTDFADPYTAPYVDFEYEGDIEVRPYSSRHSTATELELLGVSPSVIASVLRHKNYATTAKHYIDITTDKALEAVEKINVPNIASSNTGSNTK